MISVTMSTYAQSFEHLVRLGAGRGLPLMEKVPQWDWPLRLYGLKPRLSFTFVLTMWFLRFLLLLPCLPLTAMFPFHYGLPSN